MKKKYSRKAGKNKKNYSRKGAKTQKKDFKGKLILLKTFA
jgi:hypothetical protein